MNKFEHELLFSFDNEALIIRTYNRENDFACCFIPSKLTTIKQLMVQIKDVERVMRDKLNMRKIIKEIRSE